MVLHIKSVLERLGLDFEGSWNRLCASWGPTWLQLGAQERSRAAQEQPRSAQELPKTVQDQSRAPKMAQEQPRSCPRQPKSLPKADQDAQEQPRTCPGPARTARDPTHYLRLDKKSKLHNAIPQNFFPSHKAAEIKNERRRYSPQGGLQSAAQRGRRVR